MKTCAFNGIAFQSALREWEKKKFVKFENEWKLQRKLISKWDSEMELTTEE